jgi:hypothetical protein
MKEQITRREQGAIDGRLGALTSEQIEQEPCSQRFGFWYADFHRWERVRPLRDYNTYWYFQCARCYDRKAVCILRAGYSPADNYWLQGKPFDWMPEWIPTSAGPRSVVAPPHG